MFPHKTLYAPLLSPIRAKSPAHVIRLDFVHQNNIWRGVQSCCTKWSVHIRGRREILRNIVSLHSHDLLAPRPNPKLKNRPFSGVRYCLLNIFGLIGFKIGTDFRLFEFSNETPGSIESGKFLV
jgi:hypothetical protein